ncbi:hypothetical protein BsWGS_14546 [Bradybaena similaris]
MSESLEPRMEATPPDELKEFEKLDLLLSQIPKKAQHGLLMSCDLVLTCIDANSVYIALGTNVGVVFMYSRRDFSMQRLKCASTNDVITCVRLHHGIDDQLAFATAAGDLSVYFIPGVNSFLKRQLQKFEVKDIHRHYVTCLEWSTNGMKLYSGDKNGLVVTTEVDFFEGQCRSSILLVETSSEIIQLDYKHKLLMVSTRQRSFIVRLDLKCQVIPIGTKDRKILGPFGACFLPGMCKADDARLYAARPGCRLWLADVSGVVVNTHIFTDPLSLAVPEIPLLSAGKLQTGQSEFQFGILKCFREKEIVTWSSTALVVLDPEANRVVARQGRLNGIVDVAVVGETGEMFLLRRHAEARVVRLAGQPEPPPITMETVPVMLAERTAQKDEAEKENPAQSFFRKLAKPLKNLDKALVSHNQPDPAAPAPARIPAVTSPDLPPVVRLASPELEGVRVFTGGANELTVPAAASSGGAGMTNSTHLVTTASTPHVAAAAALPTSAAAVPQIKTEVSTEQPATPHALSDKGDSTPPVQNPREASIVYSHRMKKHRKKKAKEGLLVPKNKDIDSVSLVSASSQLSDDSVGTCTPTHNSAGTCTPTHDSAGTRTPTHDTVLNTLETADHVLTLVNSLLHGQGEAALSSPAVLPTEAGRAILLSSGDTLPDHYDKLAASPERTIVINEEKSKAPSIGPETTGNVLAMTTERANTILSNPAIVTNVDVSIEHSDRCSPATTDSYPVAGSTNSESTTIYDSDSTSKSVSTSYLSECDQHLQLNNGQTTVSLGSKLAKNASSIVEHAIATLSKSPAAIGESEQENGGLLQSGPQPSHSKSVPSSEISVQDVYSEIEVIESTDPFHKGYKRRNSADDFYSLFLDTSPESPMSPVSNPLPIPVQHPFTPEPERSTEMQDVAERRLANSWSEFTTSANIYSLALSNNQIWYTDKGENIYYSSFSNPKGIQWRKVTDFANQISVSPSGNIVWRLHRGVVYAGTKISTRRPEGLKWVEAVRDVKTISVDNDCAWFIMNNGDVMMQRRLSLERPCYKSQKVDCSYKVKYIIVRYGIIWAITEELQLLARTGVSDALPEGTGWQVDNREVPPYLFSHVAVDNDNIGWAIDVLGQVWFCDGVTREQPLGRRHWWQVPQRGEYILQDKTSLDAIRELALKFDPMKLSHVLRTKRSGLITAGSHGVWLVMDFKNVLQACRGNVQGYHWREAQPAQMSPKSTWRQVCAEVSHLEWGSVWAQHTNGDVFTFKRAGTEASMIADCTDICCLAVGPTAAWALTSNGVILVRKGMGPDCPQGTGWLELDISQLGQAHLVHISCNSLYVWAVEADGTVYHRIGARPPSQNSLSPAWLAIDSFDTILFTRIYVSQLDWLVWALDNRRLIYIRAGITELLPIGQEWVHVPGIQAMDLALTKTGVWALTPNGEIFFRYGITKDRPCGDYWKQIPGTFIRISASANDELWGISAEGQLMQCSVRYLARSQDSSDPLVLRSSSISSSMSEDVDWEIV